MSVELNINIRGLCVTKKISLTPPPQKKTILSWEVVFVIVSH